MPPYLRIDANTWRDEETGLNVPPAQAAQIEARWQAAQRPDSLRGDELQMIGRAYRTDDPATDVRMDTPRQPATRAHLSDAEVRARIDRFEERADKIQRIKALYPDFDPFGRDDTYLDERLRLINERDKAVTSARDSHDVPSSATAYAQRGDAVPDSDKARADALSAPLNMHKTDRHTPERGSPGSTAAPDANGEPRNDVASIIRDMSRPVDRSHLARGDGKRGDVGGERGNDRDSIIRDMSRAR